MSNNKWQDAVRAAIRDEGLDCTACDLTGGNHLRFTVAFNSKSRALYTSYTPSDWRAIKHVRKDIRRLKQEMS